jgi:hypothetical protein
MSNSTPVSPISAILGDAARRDVGAAVDAMAKPDVRPNTDERSASERSIGDTYENLRSE